MAKKKTKYVCQSCGYISPAWIGKCPECSGWSTFVEEVAEEETSKGALGKRVPKVTAVSLKDVRGLETARTATGMPELDQVLGGGLVKGSVLLVGGEPGIGKSTIMLQVAGLLSRDKLKVLYVSGEESAAQLKLRGDRLGVSKNEIDILSTNSLEDVLQACDEEKPDYIILDSIQTVASDDLNSAAGTVGQVKHVTYRLVEIAKSRGITVMIVGQVTKDGYIAGPKVLEHLVDTVLYFEGDYSRGVRILRSVKNRFGPTNEVGIFEMTDKGLLELSSYSFVEDAKDNSAGRVFVPIMEGTRAFLIEVQALVAPTFYQFPKRNCMGFDHNRLNMLLAVLEKKGGLNLAGSDIYINVAGGMRITEPSADFAICAAIVSSFRDRPIPPETTFIGEVGLTGVIRPVSNMGSRLSESYKMGIRKYYLPEKVEFDKSIEIGLSINISKFLDMF
ncbi:MAG: DNA repair protein RadA [Denitrovibrio sp.]|nr:MAG: DNA repair protein RadA [Denitrovibrio sp.]